MILNGCIKHYDWGKIGKNSLIFQTLNRLEKNDSKNENNLENTNDLTKQNDLKNQNDFYSELWMGTHDQGPCRISFDLKVPFQQKSPEIISMDENDLSKRNDSKNENDLEIKSDLLHVRLNRKLSILFKMLSIEKSLSIQAHPDEKLAKKLNQLFPMIYKDDQAKPEMVVAITPMELLCCFRPLEDIYIFSCHIPELRFLKVKKLSKMHVIEIGWIQILERNACLTFLLNLSRMKISSCKRRHLNFIPELKRQITIPFRKKRNVF
jgi:mannose-6-phosphate isomerase